MPPICKSVITALCFFVISLLSLNICSVSAFEYVYHFCPNHTNLFAPNSVYHRNLNSLLSSLSSTAGFHNLTVGRDTPDAAYGLTLCRGDVSADVCKDCVETAAGDVLQKCPKERTSVIWYDQCMIRYSNSYFFSTLALGQSVRLYNGGNVSDPDQFMDLMGTTIQGASERAVADRSGKKFVTGEATFTSSQRLYTLVQCTPDLSTSDCRTCLETAIGNLPSCYGGKQGGRVLSPSCNVRFEVFRFYNSSAWPPTPPPPILLTPSPTQASTPAIGGKGKISSITILAIVVPIVISVVLFVIAYCILRSRTKKQDNAVCEDNAEDEISDVESLQYDFSTVCAATNNFSSDNKLGEGGFGEVFKGTLPNGQEIAVKRLSKSSGQGAEEFMNEVVLVAKLQHRNLVRLLGFCLEGEEKILVYEFVPNKSLDHFLFGMETLEGGDSSIVGRFCLEQLVSKK